MTGPKHLWSGDWERESAENAADLASQPAPEAPLIVEDQTEARRRFSVRQLAVGIVGLLVVAAVAVALVVSLGGSSSMKPAAHPRTHHSGPAAPGQVFPGSSGGVTPAHSNPTPVISGPSAEWLGMQIVTSPSGAAIDTVRAGSAGDQAGFEPGDVITAIGDTQVDTVRGLGAATAKLPLGRRLTVTISRGSSTLTEAVTLKVRPTIRP